MAALDWPIQRILGVEELLVFLLLLLALGVRLRFARIEVGVVVAVVVVVILVGLLLLAVALVLQRLPGEEEDGSGDDSLADVVPDLKVGSEECLSGGKIKLGRLADFSGVESLWMVFCLCRSHSHHSRTIIGGLTIIRCRFSWHIVI